MEMKTYTLGRQSCKTTATAKRGMNAFLVLVTPISSGAATSAHRSLKSARSTDAPRVGKMQRCRRAQHLDPLRFQLPAGLAQKQLAERLAMAYPLGPDLLFPPEPREVQTVLRPRERSGCLGFHARLHCRKKQVLSAASCNGHRRRALSTTPTNESC